MEKYGRQPSQADDLRTRAEKMLGKAELPEAMTPDEMRSVIHELRVHQVELALQNEALRDARSELEASLNIYDFAPVGYLILDRDGFILAANLTAARELARDRAVLIGTPFVDYVAPGDQDTFFLHERQVLQSRERQTCVIRLATPTDHYLRIESVAAVNSTGHEVCRTSFIDVTEKKLAEIQLKRTLQEKESLLKEIHHRTKNNLQVIASLLSLQMAKMPSMEARNAIRDCKGRIQAMAFIHEMLYRHDNLSSINLDQYISQLTDAIGEAYWTDADKVRIHLDIAPISLDIKQAAPLGLVLNELVTNALKYAFPGERRGRVEIKARYCDHRVEIVVSDDGVGFSDIIDWREVKTLGLNLARMLTEDQLGGTIDHVSALGTRFMIGFSPRCS